MKKVTRVQTSDGVLHLDFDRAFHHADQRYGNALTKLAGELVRIDKYLDMTNFIDENLSRFEELSRLKQDTVVEPMDEEQAEDLSDEE